MITSARFCGHISIFLCFSDFRDFFFTGTDYRYAGKNTFHAYKTLGNSSWLYGRLWCDSIIQSLIISLYIIYVLNVMMIGSFFWVLTITLLTAISALTLGMLLSTLANNEFQMVQFIPIVIVPQIFLSGIFDLSPLWLAIGHLTPIYYVTDALTEVMIRGGGLYEIWPDLILIVGFSLFFMALNTRILRKYRWI